MRQFIELPNMLLFSINFLLTKRKSGG